MATRRYDSTCCICILLTHSLTYITSLVFNINGERPKKMLHSTRSHNDLPNYWPVLAYFCTLTWNDGNGKWLSICFTPREREKIKNRTMFYDFKIDKIKITVSNGEIYLHWLYTPSLIAAYVNAPEFSTISKNDSLQINLFFQRSISIIVTESDCIFHRVAECWFTWTFKYGFADLCTFLYYLEVNVRIKSLRLLNSVFWSFSVL